MDSNSNNDNRQQKISDAIELLSHLTTGIDVNMKFRRIGDFEFSPKCAIFDLLDIPLYHGWLVDPQDSETAKAIGSKSYDTTTLELASLEAAALGVPSPPPVKKRRFGGSTRGG